jgi:WD40 repeat protein
MKKIFTAVLCAVLGLTGLSCSKENHDNPDLLELDLKARVVNESGIEIHEPDLYPEGLDYDKRGNRFLISSITRGDVGQVIDGEYSLWVTNPDFVSTIGLHVDQSRKRVLITNSNIDGSLAALAAYDLSGELIFYTELHTLRAGGHFANDVTVDHKGNSYVTDSYAGILYKLNQQGEAEIFLEDESLAPAPGAFGLNGIDYDPRGFLLVGKADSNILIQVPLDEPESWTDVNLDAPIFSPDGLYLKNPNELLVVSNDFGGENSRVQTFRTKDKWETATLVEEFLTPNEFTTTITMRKNSPYVMVAHLDVLLSGGSTNTFTILKAE